MWARAYIAAPGCHHLEVNGQVPAPDLRGICPWPVDASKHVRFMARDITAAAVQGANAFGLVAGHVMYSHAPKVLAVFIFRYASGTAPTVVTSGADGWQGRSAYVTKANAWATTIDWSQHDPRWSTPGFVPAEPAWAPVNTSALKPANVPPRALAMPLSAVLGEVRPLKVQKVGPADWLYTFPKNFVGTVRLKPLPDAAAGAVLDVLAGEWLVSAPAPAPSGSAPSGSPARCQRADENKQVNLGCDSGHNISGVVFAAYGTPTGTCADGFAHSTACDAPSATAVVAAACVGKPRCTVNASTAAFGGKDPCLHVKKRLSARVRCDNDAPTPAPVPSIPAISNPKHGEQQHEVHVLRPGNTAPLETLFCWHGFQYVRVSGSGGATGFAGGLDDIVGLEIHTNLTTASTLAFGGGTGQQSALLNGLLSMARASQLSNVAAYMPTDCPTREKHGWMGDALDASEQAFYGFDMRSVHEGFLQTSQDNQLVGGDVPHVVPAAMHNTGDSCDDIAWTAVYPILANLLHRYYGDTRAIRRRWASLRRYADNLLAHDQPLGVATCDRFQDWLCGNHQSCCTNAPAGSACPVPQMMGAFGFVLTLRAMAEMAVAIGETADAASYRRLAVNATSAFHGAFWSDELGAYGGDQGAVQSMAVPALLIGSAPTDNITTKVVAALDANVAAPGVGQPPYTLRVGAVTSKVLLDVLSSHGKHDSALRLAMQTAEPSWGYWWANNATTCWENWPGNSGFPVPTGWVHGDSAGTRNHIFLCGGLVEWYWKHLVGLTPASPAFATVRVAPKVRPYLGPTELDATYDSVRGTIVVSWEIAEQGKSVYLDVALPVGVQGATVAVPKPFASPAPGGRAARTVVSEDWEGGTVVWDGTKLVGDVPGVLAARDTAEGIEFNVTNGRFRFSATVGV